METQQLWIDLEPDYIDKNFDKFLRYLIEKQSETDKDDFYSNTLKLLTQRVTEIIHQQAFAPIFQLDRYLSPNTTPPSQQKHLELRILGAFLLCKDITDLVLRKQALLAQILIGLSLTSPDDVQYDETLDTAVALATHDYSVVPAFEWSDVRDFTSFPIFLHKVHQSAHDVEKSARVFYGNGCAHISPKGLKIGNLELSDKVVNSTIASLSVAERNLEVLATQQTRLVVSKQKDFNEVEDFFARYKKSLSIIHSPTAHKPKYVEGDILRVRVTKNSCNQFLAESTDPDFEHIKGKLFFDSRYFINYRDFMDVLSVGDLIDVRIKKFDRYGNPEFDITDEFQSFIKNEYEPLQIGSSLHAVFDHEQYNVTWWRTDCGIQVKTLDTGHGEGSWAYLKVSQKDGDFFIADFEGYTDETFDPEEAKENCILRFTYEPDESLPANSTDDDSDQCHPLSACDLGLAAHVIYRYQKLISKPIERYSTLGALLMLYAAINTPDDDSLSIPSDEYRSSNAQSEAYIALVLQSVREMVRFAHNDFNGIKSLIPDATIEHVPEAKYRVHTIDILRSYAISDDDNANDDYLDQMIDSDVPKISKLAQLVQSARRLRSILSKPMQVSIKREIARLLSVDEETSTDLANDDENFMGMEDSTHEFKTSFIYPPDNNMQPNEGLQRHNILRGVCAFLNSYEGGHLFLGVDDLGHVVGVANDMRYLKQKSMDSYARYVNDAIVREFGTDVALNIKISPIRDNQVLDIAIQPCLHKIVRLDDVPYIRINAESRKMDESTRKQILEQRKKATTTLPRIIASLQNAIAEKKQVVLKSYCSSHSGNRRDRKVEPFAFTHAQNMIWCYDIDDKMVKLFHTRRMADIEDLGTRWEHAEEHREGNVDIFSTSGPTPIPIKLSLNMRARNLLLEEYPGAEHFITPEGNRWFFETTVYNLSGVARFYMGLAADIQIIDTPCLREYVKNYVKEHLS